MKNLLGVLLILLGIVLGIYLGLWVCFIGGIVQLIEAIKIAPVNAMGIALGIARIVSSSVVGWLSFIICVGCGRVLLD